MIRRRVDGTFFGYKLWTGIEHAMPVLSKEPIKFDKYDLMDLFPIIAGHENGSTEYTVLLDEHNYRVIRGYTRNLTDSFLVLGYYTDKPDYTSIFFVAECGIATVPHSSKTAMVQTLLWRKNGPSEFSTLDFVFRHILPQVGTILSDKIQTSDGKGFWLRLLDLAYTKKKFVYLSTRDDLIDISDDRDFVRNNLSNIWGDVNKGSTRIAISNTEIWRNNK